MPLWALLLELLSVLSLALHSLHTGLPLQRGASSRPHSIKMAATDSFVTSPSSIENFLNPSLDLDAARAQQQEEQASSSASGSGSGAKSGGGKKTLSAAARKEKVKAALEEHKMPSAETLRRPAREMSISLMADEPHAQSSLPAVRARVCVDWGGAGRQFKGIVNQHRTILNQRQRLVNEFHVSYDDGEQQWHDPTEWTFHVVDEQSADITSSEWLRIEQEKALKQESDDEYEYENVTESAGSPPGTPGGGGDPAFGESRSKQKRRKRLSLGV